MVCHRRQFSCVSFYAIYLIANDFGGGRMSTVSHCVALLGHASLTSDTYRKYFTIDNPRNSPTIIICSTHQHAL